MIQTIKKLIGKSEKSKVAVKNLKIRDRHISEVVSGKSFGDVGGLWGTVNEKLSIAHNNGAKSLTMVDQMPLNSQYWKLFKDRMKELSIKEYSCVKADICDPNIVELTGGGFDVIHCSGVLYHHPYPLLVLVSLKKITKEYLIFTSAIIPEVIENNKGRFVMPSSGSLFIPALQRQEKEVIKEYYMNEVGLKYLAGISEETKFSVTKFGPWWWIPTAKCLLAMCECAGFEILEHDEIGKGNACVVLLKTK